VFAEAQEEQNFHTHDEAQGCGARRGNRQRLRPLEIKNFSQVWEESTEAQERMTVVK
jgi:hypothetical protein